MISVYARFFREDATKFFTQPAFNDGSNSQEFYKFNNESTGGQTVNKNEI